MSAVPIRTPPIDPLPEAVDPFTELATAYRFVIAHGADVRHCAALGGWLVWDGARWSRNEPRVVQLMIETVRELLRYTGHLFKTAKSKEDEDRAQKYATFARKSQSEPAIRRAIALAKDFAEITSRADAWDRDRMLFACPNGTVDLNTGELRESRREDMITRIAGAAFNPRAAAPLWERVVERAQPIEAVRVFMQSFAGYSLTGDVGEQCLGVLWGDGANSKSTIIEMLKRAMGDYAIEAAGETFLATAKGRSTDNKMADLRGARFVTSSESGEGRKLDETLVKRVTGGDEVTANHLYGETFRFYPAFKLWICTNHRPDIRGVDHGIWRRVRLIPFTVTIPPEEQDPALTQKLTAELEGILAWMVRGCVAWREHGLRPPPEVLAATAEWREEANDVASFVADRCDLGEWAKVKSGAIYGAFREWCSAQGCEVISAKAFGQRLAKLGYVADRTNAEGRIWRGIGLRQGGDDA